MLSYRWILGWRGVSSHYRDEAAYAESSRPHIAVVGKGNCRSGPSGPIRGPSKLAGIYRQELHGTHGNLAHTRSPVAECLSLASEGFEFSKVPFNARRKRRFKTLRPASHLRSRQVRPS